MQDVLQRRSRGELLEVLSLHCLDYGCQHVCAEWFLHSGVLEQPSTPLAWKECTTKCAMCTGDWKKSFLKVNLKEVSKFLKHMVRAKIPLVACFENVVDPLWNDESARIEKIYYRKKVQRNNVDSLFCQLTAPKMIVLKNNTEGIQWDIGETIDPSDDDDFIFHYDLDEYWIHIHTY